MPMTDENLTVDPAIFLLFNKESYPSLKMPEVLQSVKTCEDFLGQFFGNSLQDAMKVGQLRQKILRIYEETQQFVEPCKQQYTAMAQIIKKAHHLMIERCESSSDMSDDGQIIFEFVMVLICAIDSLNRSAEMSQECAAIFRFVLSLYAYVFHGEKVKSDDTKFESHLKYNKLLGLDESEKEKIRINANCVRCYIKQCPSYRMRLVESQLDVFSLVKKMPEIAPREGILAYWNYVVSCPENNVMDVLELLKRIMPANQDGQVLIPEISSAVFCRWKNIENTQRCFKEDEALVMVMFIIRFVRDMRYISSNSLADMSNFLVSKLKEFLEIQRVVDKMLSNNPQLIVADEMDYNVSTFNALFSVIMVQQYLDYPGDWSHCSDGVEFFCAVIMYIFAKFQESYDSALDNALPQGVVRWSSHFQEVKNKVEMWISIVEREGLLKAKESVLKESTEVSYKEQSDRRRLIATVRARWFHFGWRSGNRGKFFERLSGIRGRWVYLEQSMEALWVTQQYATFNEVIEMILCFASDHPQSSRDFLDFIFKKNIEHNVNLLPSLMAVFKRRQSLRSIELVERYFEKISENPIQFKVIFESKTALNELLKEYRSSKIVQYLYQGVCHLRLDFSENATQGSEEKPLVIFEKRMALYAVLREKVKAFSKSKEAKRFSDIINVLHNSVDSDDKIFQIFIESYCEHFSMRIGIENFYSVFQEPMIMDFVCGILIAWFGSLDEKQDVEVIDLSIVRDCFDLDQKIFNESAFYNRMLLISSLIILFLHAYHLQHPHYGERAPCGIRQEIFQGFLKNIQLGENFYGPFAVLTKLYFQYFPSQQADWLHRSSMLSFLTQTKELQLDIPNAATAQVLYYDAVSLFLTKGHIRFDRFKEEDPSLAGTRLADVFADQDHYSFSLSVLERNISRYCQWKDFEEDSFYVFEYIVQGTVVRALQLTQEHLEDVSQRMGLPSIELATDFCYRLIHKPENQEYLERNPVACIKTIVQIFWLYQQLVLDCLSQGEVGLALLYSFQLLQSFDKITRLVYSTEKSQTLLSKAWVSFDHYLHSHYLNQAEKGECLPFSEQVFLFDEIQSLSRIADENHALLLLNWITLVFKILDRDNVRLLFEDISFEAAVLLPIAKISPHHFVELFNRVVLSSGFSDDFDATFYRVSVKIGIHQTIFRMIREIEKDNIEKVSWFLPFFEVMNKEKEAKLSVDDMSWLEQYYVNLLQIDVARKRKKITVLLNLLCDQLIQHGRLLQKDDVKKLLGDAHENFETISEFHFSLISEKYSKIRYLLSGFIESIDEGFCRVTLPVGQQHAIHMPDGWRGMLKDSEVTKLKFIFRKGEFEENWVNKSKVITSPSKNSVTVKFFEGKIYKESLEFYPILLLEERKKSEKEVVEKIGLIEKKIIEIKKTIFDYLCTVSFAEGLSINAESKSRKEKNLASEISQFKKEKENIISKLREIYSKYQEARITWNHLTSCSLASDVVSVKDDEEKYRKLLAVLSFLSESLSSISELFFQRDDRKEKIVKLCGQLNRRSPFLEIHNAAESVAETEEGLVARRIFAGLELYMENKGPCIEELIKEGVLKDSLRRANKEAAEARQERRSPAKPKSMPKETVMTVVSELQAVPGVVVTKEKSKSPAKKFPIQCPLKGCGLLIDSVEKEERILENQRKKEFLARAKKEFVAKAVDLFIDIESISYRENQPLTSLFMIIRAILPLLNLCIKEIKLPETLGSKHNIFLNWRFFRYTSTVDVMSLKKLRSFLVHHLFLVCHLDVLRNPENIQIVFKGLLKYVKKIEDVINERSYTSETLIISDAIDREIRNPHNIEKRKNCMTLKEKNSLINTIFPEIDAILIREGGQSPSVTTREARYCAYMLCDTLLNDLMLQRSGANSLAIFKKRVTEWRHSTSRLRVDFAFFREAAVQSSMHLIEDTKRLE